MSKLKTIALLSASIAAVSGCGHSNETLNVATGKAREIAVTEQSHTLKLDAYEEGELTAQDLEQINEFIAKFRQNGYGAVSLNAPDTPGAQKVVNSVRSMFLSAGLIPEKLMVTSFMQDENSPSPMVMTYRSYKASVPGCTSVNQHDWSEIGTNAALPSFGCAVNQNIAEMIAYPGDLNGSRTIGPGDASRQLTVYEKYRLGENTASSQEADGSSTADVGQ
jgi:pilus assembly protein CpaD